MKNEKIILSDVVETYTSKEQLSNSFLSIGGKILPAGCFFQPLAIVRRKAVSVGGNEYDSVVINFGSTPDNLDKQIGVSKRFFDGSYFEASKLENGEIDTNLKSIETPLTKSGVDIWDFVNANKETTFVVKHALTYNAQPFAAIGQPRKNIMKQRDLTTYAVYVAE